MCICKLGVIQLSGVCIISNHSSSMTSFNFFFLFPLSKNFVLLIKLLKSAFINLSNTWHKPGDITRRSKIRREGFLHFTGKSTLINVVITRSKMMVIGYILLLVKAISLAVVGSH